MEGTTMNVKVKVWRSMSKQQRYLLLLAISTYQKQKRLEAI
jgi:hypothetical protein